jgi:short-subunit dehydrogenase
MSETLRLELMIHRIDVIVIAPGAVRTAIWDKFETEDSSAYAKTEYRDNIDRFRRYFIGEGKKGLPPKRLGEAVHLALTARRPRTRYAVVPQRFKS